jgi:hypothetical protein
MTTPVRRAIGVALIGSSILAASLLYFVGCALISLESYDSSSSHVLMVWAIPWPFALACAVGLAGLLCLVWPSRRPTPPHLPTV